jgi:uncharacterized cupin superfamily protein
MNICFSNDGACHRWRDRVEHKMIIIRQAAGIPAAQLDELGPVKEPLSWPPSELIGRKIHVGRPGVRMMGVWECSPGRWQRTIMQEEFAHFIEGSARFIPDNGEPIDIKAGDTIWFPPRSRGVWEITEKVRKVYIILYRRNPLAAAWSLFTSLFPRFRLWAELRPQAEQDAAPVAPEHGAPLPQGVRRLT